MNTKQALDLLKAGNARFVSGALTPKDNYATLREQLSTGQHPFAVVLRQPCGT
jgi:carbonic anhydrase